MTDLRQQLQATLGDAYALERELLGGGMSRVFVAMDAALNRRVVVKVLSPELAQGISAERFAREIKVAAALQDPHIVPVHSAGESGGLPYYTMPFVEGESLRARLLRGTVPFNDAVGILRDVALALEYAHAHGVVHRDIKPENVLLAGRTAVVADFGIAKAVSAARTGAPEVRDGTLTSIGQSLGTPAYMAPEQVAGETIDNRSDLYAWGVMAYEVLAGRHPFADKASASQLMAAQLSERPAPLIEKKPGIPPPIAALVMSCLEKLPDLRPQGASDVVSALDAIQSPSAASGSGPAFAQHSPARSRRTLVAAIGGAAIAVAVVALFLSQQGRSSSPSTAAPAAGALTIAVLPFENLGDSADLYFADGITDAVRGKLTSLSGVGVIARASSAQYARTTKLPPEIANELGVRYLLTGTVRFAGSGAGRRVQVSPELVEIADGQPQSRWQEPFDAEVKDVFQVQGEIAGKVAEAMRLALGGGAQQQLAQPLTNDPAAYDAYLRGEAAWNAGTNTDPATLRRAIPYFEQAIARDSTMTEAWGALSRARSLLYNNGTPTTQLQTGALAAARRAVALEPNGAAGHRAMGWYYRVVSSNTAVQSLQEFELALSAAPASVAILTDVANVKDDLGRFDESVRDREAAIRLDPRNPRLLQGQARTLLRLRRIPEARAAAERALVLGSTSLQAVMARLLAEAASGNLAGARQVIAAAARDIPEPRVLAYVGAYWDMGWVLDSASATHLLALGPDAFDDDRGQWGLVRAQQYHLRGDNVQARAWGDTAARHLEAQLQEAPLDAQRHILRGWALVFSGRGQEGIAESARGLALARADSTSVWSVAHGYLNYVAARTSLVAGDKGRAIELLAESMRLRYFVSPAWLRIDPTWNPVRGDSRFERLLNAP
jgi:eukaryotic-like serine/threonine-protein kinase